MTLPSLSFGGLATPFDVNSLIDQIMAAERIPLLNLQATRQSYQDKDAAWAGIVTKVSALRTSVDSLDLDNFAKVTTSNEDAVTASVTGTPKPGSVTFDVLNLAVAHTVHSTATTASATELLGSGDFTVTVGGVDSVVTLDGSQSITDLATLITALNVGVTASAVNTGPAEYRLVVTADNTGAAAAFSVDSDISSFTGFDTTVIGADSKIQLGTSGGNPLVIERATNSISGVLDGVTFELHALANNVTVSAVRDFNGSGTGASDFVDKINDVLNELATLTSYDASSGKAGVLAGDSTARSLMLSLRSAVSGSVGAGPTTYVGPAVGIAINRTGTFDFDQAKFESSLSSDFDGVKAFLEGVVLVNLDTALDNAEGVTGSIARARDRWNSQISYVDDRIDDMEDRLDNKQAFLIRRFASLDVALQTLNSQSAWLSSQISGFKKSS